MLEHTITGKAVTADPCTIPVALEQALNTVRGCCWKIEFNLPTKPYSSQYAPGRVNIFNNILTIDINNNNIGYSIITVNMGVS